MSARRSAGGESLRRQSQKVALAKALAADPDIIIFDEPTKGIDVGAKQEIYQLMNDLVESGKAIIMVSSDMEEILGMSDRIIVLHEGLVRRVQPGAGVAAGFGRLREVRST